MPSAGERCNSIHCFDVTRVGVMMEKGKGGGAIGIEEGSLLIKCIFGQHA